MRPPRSGCNRQIAGVDQAPGRSCCRASPAAPPSTPRPVTTASGMPYPRPPATSASTALATMLTATASRTAAAAVPAATSPPASRAVDRVMASTSTSPDNRGDEEKRSRPQPVQQQAGGQGHDAQQGTETENTCQVERVVQGQSRRFSTRLVAPHQQPRRREENHHDGRHGEAERPGQLRCQRSADDRHAAGRERTGNNRPGRQAAGIVRCLDCETGEGKRGGSRRCQAACSAGKNDPSRWTGNTDRSIAGTGNQRDHDGQEPELERVQRVPGGRSCGWAEAAGRSMSSRAAPAPPAIPAR